MAFDEAIVPQEGIVHPWSTPVPRMTPGMSLQLLFHRTSAAAEAIVDRGIFSMGIDF
jgi:hypothetical protein